MIVSQKLEKNYKNVIKSIKNMSNGYEKDLAIGSLVADLGGRRISAVSNFLNICRAKVKSCFENYINGKQLTIEFRGRIESLLKETKEDFKKFYVDTVLLFNTKALEPTIDYFGIDHFLYGTDALFGIMPNVAVKEIEDAINTLPISDEEIIYNKDISNFIKNH